MSLDKNIKLLTIAEFEIIECAENEIYFEKQYDTVTISLNESSSRISIWITNVDNEDNQYFDYSSDLEKLVIDASYNEDYKDTVKQLYDELFTNKLRNQKLERLLA